MADDSSLAIGGTAPTVGMLPTPPMTQSAASPDNSQQLLTLLKLIAMAKQRGGQAGGQVQSTPGVVGGPPPQMQGGGSVQGGGPGGGIAPAYGSMAKPQSQPGMAGYQAPPFGSEMMSKLDPTGAAVYASAQSMQQVLQNHFQRQDQKEQGQAANIAQNLMQAIDNNDTATVHDILNDKNSTKILNKVYKGWLQKAQESQQPGEPPDPTVSGFESGMKQYQQKKAQQPSQSQGQGQGQGQKTGQQQSNIVGGYRLPQAGPAQLAQRTAAQNALRQQQAQASLSPEDLQRQARIGAGLEPNAADQAKIADYQAQVQKAQIAADADVKKAHAELLKTQAEVQMAGVKTQAAKDEAKYNLLTKNVELQIAQTRLQTAKMGGKLQPTQLAKLGASTQALSIIDNITSGKGDSSTNTLTNLKNQLRNAGLTGAAAMISDGGRNVTTGKPSTATTSDELKRIRPSVLQYQQAFSFTPGASQLPEEDDNSDDSVPDAQSGDDNEGPF